MKSHVINFLAFYFGWSMMASINNDFSFIKTILASGIYTLSYYLIEKIIEDLKVKN
jgi:hypothetical protein